MKRSLLFLLTVSSAYAADIQINTSAYENLPQGTTELNAIVLDKNGQMSEQKATLNPANSAINVNVTPGEQASVFFPELGERYLYSNGNWVNKAGYYYNNNSPVYVGTPGWDASWNDYWNNNWHNHWNNYYNGRHGDANWRYHNNPHWNHHWHDHRHYNRHNGHHGNRDHGHQGHHSHHHSGHHSGHHGGHHGGHKK